MLLGESRYSSYGQWTLVLFVFRHRECEECMHKYILLQIKMADSHEEPKKSILHSKKTGLLPWIVLKRPHKV